MRRLPLLLILGLLAAAPPAGAAAPPKLPTDAAAMSAVSTAAVKIERCRSKTIDYTRCDSAHEVRLARGTLVEASTERGYTVAGRSRQGRRFTLTRAEASLLATCTPAGRGKCGPPGTWRPRPKAVMSPAWGTEWLAHERELTTRMLAVAGLIEACGAGAGDYRGCRSAEVDALAGQSWPHRLDVMLGERDFTLATVSAASTEFLYQHTPEGTVERLCRFFGRQLTSPCDGERW